MNYEQREYVNQIINSANRYLWLTFQRNGVHYHVNIAQRSVTIDDPYINAASVSTHRHLFKFKISIEIIPDEKIECYQVLEFCELLYQNNELDINFKSTEDIADELYIRLAEKYPNRNFSIEIGEDGECGCHIDYRK